MKGEVLDKWNNSTGISGDITNVPLNDIVSSLGTNLNVLFSSLLPSIDSSYRFTLSNEQYAIIKNQQINTNYISMMMYDKTITAPDNFNGHTLVAWVPYITDNRYDTDIYYVGADYDDDNDYQSVSHIYPLYVTFDDELRMYTVNPIHGGTDAARYASNFRNWIKGITPPTRYDDNYSVPDEGEGDFDNTSDIVNQDLFDVLVQNAFTTTYYITAGNLGQLYNWLWTDDIITNLSKMFSNPLDSILSLQIAPFTSNQLPLGSERNVALGNIDSGVQAQPISKGFIRVDCGTLTLSEYFGNFLDYPPYTQIQCYLPYIGYIPLDATDVIGSAIQLYYDVDLSNGFFTANIVVMRDRYGTQLDAILYSYSGSMFYNTPVTSANYSAVTSGLINVATNALSGNAPGFVESSSALLIATSHPDIQRSGSLSNNANLVTLRVPHVRITRPRLAIAKTLQQEKGYYCNVTCKLSDLSGYVEVRHVDLSNISGATENEKSEIENLLNSGVFI